MIKDVRDLSLDICDKTILTVIILVEHFMKKSGRNEAERG